MDQASGGGLSGIRNAETIRTSLFEGHGRDATSSTAAWLQGDPSTAKRILIPMLPASHSGDFGAVADQLQADSCDLSLNFAPARHGGLKRSGHQDGNY